MSGWRKSDDQGSAVIEFALVLPILVMLVFGIFQFGLFFNRQQGFHAAAREGARVGAIPTSTVGEIETRVTDALDGIPIGGTSTITITPAGAADFKPCDSRQGQSVIVEVEAPTTIEIPLWGTKNLTITGRGEFRCE